MPRGVYKRKSFSLKHRNNLRISHLGHAVTKEVRDKISKKLRGKKKPPRSKEHSNKIRESIKKKWLDPGSKYNHIGRSNKLRKWMLSGHAAYMNSFITDPSKKQLELFRISCEILPYPILNYPVYRVGKGKRSYNLDIADFKLGIAIEFDGYYHFYDQEHIDYHKKRQKELEEEGWKFIRYDIFHSFPTKEQVFKDIQTILRN